MPSGRGGTRSRGAVVLPFLVAVAILALGCSNASAPGPTTTTVSCPPVTGDTASSPGQTTTTTPSCLPAADDTDTPSEGPSNEWRGTFAGTVTWDCGPIGERTGRLTGEYKITTDAIGHAFMGGTKTVTGLCAGPTTGTLTRPDLSQPRSRRLGSVGPRRRADRRVGQGNGGLVGYEGRLIKLRRRGFWLAAAVAPNQPRRVGVGGQHPAQRGDEAPDQERRYRDELQFGNHGSRLLRMPAVHTSSRLRDFGGGVRSCSTGGRPNGSAHALIAAPPCGVRR